MNISKQSQNNFQSMVKEIDVLAQLLHVYSKALDSESIGLKCFIFLNLFVGSDPMILSTKFKSLKKLKFFCNSKILFLLFSKVY